MKAKIIALITCVLLLGIPSFFFAQKKTEETNYVPDKETAIKIAEAIWLPIYGEKINREKPFIAELNTKRQTWIVHGTLSPNMLGGVAFIEIRKSDCKIITVFHGK